MTRRCPPYGAVTKRLLQRGGFWKWLKQQKRDRAVVVDLTYGRGRMWRCIPREKLEIIGFDVKVWDWEVYPHTFYTMDSRNPWDVIELLQLAGDTPDLVVADPPFPSPSMGREAYGRKEFQHVVGSPLEIIRSAMYLSQQYRSWLLLHWRDILSIPVQVEEGIWQIKAEEFWFRVFFAHKSRSWWGLLKYGRACPSC